MKTQCTWWLLIIFLVINVQLDAQVSGKYGSKTDKGNAGDGSIDEMVLEKTTFYTSRLDDIMEIEDYQKKMQVAIDAGDFLAADVSKSKALAVMVNEIARSKKNLKELKAGDIEHLEAYQKEHAPNYKIYINQEIRSLTNRINYEIQVYKSLKNKEITKTANDREKYAPVSYINGFKRAMERNLRYESDEKTITPSNKDGSNQKGETTTGPGVITKSGTKEKADDGNSRLNSWIQSKEQRKEDFAKNQADFQKFANNSDDNMARRSYQAIIQLMMNEINSSNWLIGQVGMGNISKGGYDTNALAGIVQQQQSILKEAQTIKVSTPDDLKANKVKALELINNFSNTL